MSHNLEDRYRPIAPADLVDTEDIFRAWNDLSDEEFERMNHMGSAPLDTVDVERGVNPDYPVLVPLEYAIAQRTQLCASAQGRDVSDVLNELVQHGLRNWEEALSWE